MENAAAYIPPATLDRGLPPTSLYRRLLLHRAKLPDAIQKSHNDRRIIFIPDPTDELFKCIALTDQVGKLNELFREHLGALQLATTPILYPPFYDFGDTEKHIFDSIEHHKKGGTGQVFRVSISPPYDEHHRLPPEYHGSFAVKKLGNGSHEDFFREYKNLTRFTWNPHPHIVPLLAAYRMQDKYHLVFPWADCDLATFWIKQKPGSGKARLHWFMDQMRGLADALTKVHGVPGDDQKPNGYGVHGDIKPDNILCFKEGNEQMIFSLADFGSSYHIPTGCVGSKRPKGLKHTPVYRAPEVDVIAQGMTQAYDVWSLGCVYAEALMWVLEGQYGVEKLAKARFDKWRNSPNRDAFFQGELDKCGRFTAQIKPEVEKLLMSLQDHPQSTPCSNSMLAIVMGGMLKTHMDERMTAREVYDALSDICKKLECDPSYSEPRGFADVEMACFHTPYFSTWSTSLTKSDFQVHTNQNANNYLTNTTTQDFEDAGSQTAKPPFACPFHKAGILVSALHRACQGPGWTSISKLKEHIIRAHLPNRDKGKHICGRCGSSFETGSLLLAHQKQEPPCRSKKSESTYGMITSEQAALLKSVRRKSNKVADEERWFEIYRIIFPSYKRSDDISPYHEPHYESTSLSTINSSTSSNGISQYKDYLRKRNVEEYAAKLAAKGITLPLEVVARLLEDQVSEIETFDETMREPVRAYEIPTSFSDEKVDTESSVPTQGRALESSDVLGQLQFLPRLENNEEF